MQLRGIIMAEKHIVKYPNGATFIYYQQNLNKTTDVTIGFLGGASLDGKKLGLAHILEHSLFFGTENMSRDEMNEIKNLTDTRYNAYTTQDCIADEFNCPSSSFENMLKINSDMLINKKIDPQVLENEKKVVLQELFMTLDNEQHTMFDDINVSSSYKKGKDILGNVHTLSEITVDDIADYKTKYFTTNNMVVSVVSDLPYEQVKSLVEKHLI